MELPKELKQERRDDGRIDLVQTTDIGTRDVVLTTKGSEVTAEDEIAIRVGDREHSSPRQFAEHFISKAQAHKAEYEAETESSYLEGVEEVMRLGAWKTTNKWGWSPLMEANWPSDWR